MNNFAVVIPAQEQNPYHKLGDLAPFGDTTLLEWKISQCKQFTDNSSIYLSTSSERITEIAKREGINVIRRSSELEYGEMLSFTMQQIREEIIVWAIPTAPFVSGRLYNSMLEKFLNLTDNDSLVSVKKLKEYIFYQNEKMNFSEEFISRRDIEPVYQVTNGCFIICKENILKNKTLFGKRDFLYEVDNLASVEIKDIEDFSFVNNLISHYFERTILEDR